MGYNRILVDNDLLVTTAGQDQEEDLRPAAEGHGAEVWEWFENGATFTSVATRHTWQKMFIALIEIAMGHGGMWKKMPPTSLRRL